MQDGALVHDEIDAITRVEDLEFVDLDVEDASNFVGGGILSHNSIYGFRGARSDLFTRLASTEGWKTKMIRTNYRCQPEIVEAANQLIVHNEGRIPMDAVPSPAKVRGTASVRVNTASDEADAALDVVEEIKSYIDAGGEVTDNAILTRTNKEQHAYETACIIRGVPYARKGASSFLGSPETTAFLSYVQLATGSDFSKMQLALGEAINKPNRFFVGNSAPAIVAESLSEYARKKRVDLKSINPVLSLGDRSFVQILAQKLTRSNDGFKFNKAVGSLNEVSERLQRMQANLSDPEYKTSDLFDDILGMTGITTVTNSVTGRAEYVEQTFRESLQAELRDKSGEDDTDDDSEESEGLGNISFLYELAKKDPTDPEDLITDPNTPIGFKSKMERMSAKMRDLRVDLTKWDKQQEALPPDQRKPPPGVNLGTIHSVKGAQWKNCYVAMPRGKFPMEPPKRPGSPPPDPLEQAEELASERRLAYVALTRAAMNLTIVCPDVVGGKAAGVSQFVGEAGLHLGENVPKLGTTEVVEVSEVKVAHGDDYEGVVPDAWADPISSYDRRQS